VLALMIGCVLFLSGIPLRLLAAAAGGIAVLIVGMVAISPNRMNRIMGFLNPSADLEGINAQPIRAMYALASGGWWGVGLGASREKSGWLPEAQNDFIFAIIGEELGLPGTLVVLALFALVATACFRLIVRSEDQFVRLASAGAMTWVILQAVINIGSVIGLLPVIGLPLPLVSAGGSALVTTLVAMGMLVSFARHEPGAAEVLATRPGMVRRSLAVLPGRRARARAGR